MTDPHVIAAMQGLLGGLTAIAQHVARQVLSPGSGISVTSLVSALAIAAAVIVFERVKRRRGMSPRLLWRALFPRWIVASRSNRVDVGLLLFNTLLFGLLFGWAIASQKMVSAGVLHLLGAGVDPPLALSPLAALTVGTVTLFLAAEFAYWICHWLSHSVPLLWEFHKVHHSAEVLTPLTNFRVHPVEGVLFANILAVVMGLTDAGLTRLFGAAPHQFAAFDRNVLALGGLYLVQHLQHTHLWVTAPGPLRNVIYSPAHHQIHHSTNPAHFGRNFGSFLTLWVWAFGTLHTPARQRERLTFGLGDEEPTHGSVADALARPMTASAARLRLSAPRRSSGTKRPQPV